MFALDSALLQICPVPFVRDADAPNLVTVEHPTGGLEFESPLLSDTLDSRRRAGSARHHREIGKIRERGVWRSPRQADLTR